MDQVHVIRHQVLVEGRSQRRVAKEFGISRLTVRKYVGEAAPRRKETGPRARPVWAAVQARVETLLAESVRWTGGKQRLTATRLHGLLVAEGHHVGVTIVKTGVAEWRRQRREVFVPLTYRPGDLAEVDFFEVLVDVDVFDMARHDLETADGRRRAIDNYLRMLHRKCGGDHHGGLTSGAGSVTAFLGRSCIGRPLRRAARPAQCDTAVLQVLQTPPATFIEQLRRERPTPRHRRIPEAVWRHRKTPDRSQKHSLIPSSSPLLTFPHLAASPNEGPNTRAFLSRMDRDPPKEAIDVLYDHTPHAAPAPSRRSRIRSVPINPLSPHQPRALDDTRPHRAARRGLARPGGGRAEYGPHRRAVG